MLIISKPTRFSPDGFASRGQCSLDSPGWQLRWFERGELLDVIWQGAFKTCRHLQTECVGAASLAEAKEKAAELLKANSLARFASMPTDTYPVARGDDFTSGHDGEVAQQNASGNHGKKRRKRKRGKS